eukprot:2819033-Pyramimonas_sp.AAC.1
MQAPGRGQVRAGADDVAAVVLAPEGFRELARAFRNAAAVAGLARQASNCFAVPLSAEQHLMRSSRSSFALS